MRLFARWHIWLGWLVGFPILMWTVTGLYMVARPIEEVRGSQLQAAPGPINPVPLSFPKMDGPIQRAELFQLPSGPVWNVTAMDGTTSSYSAVGGHLLSPIDKDNARRIAEAAYAGEATIETVTYFPADLAPLELRRNRPSWQAHYSDGTNLYLDDVTGEVLALRTRQWRLYDFMWGLHIMDLERREDTHHPILMAFAALSVLGALIGCILLFRRRKARVIGNVSPK
jgi:uncharacterized iron-regulated membrane protein